MSEQAIGDPAERVAEAAHEGEQREQPQHGQPPATFEERIAGLRESVLLDLERAAAPAGRRNSLLGPHDAAEIRNLSEALRNLEAIANSRRAQAPGQGPADERVPLPARLEALVKAALHEGLLHVKNHSTTFNSEEQALAAGTETAVRYVAAHARFGPTS